MRMLQGPATILPSSSLLESSYGGARLKKLHTRYVFNVYVPALYVQTARPPSLRTPLLSCIRSDSPAFDTSNGPAASHTLQRKTKGVPAYRERERRGTEAREPIPQPAPPSPNEHNRSSPTSPGAKRSIPHVLFLYFAYIYDTLPFQPVFRPAGQKVSSSGLGGSERKSKATLLQKSPRALTPRSPRF